MFLSEFDIPTTHLNLEIQEKSSMKILPATEENIKKSAVVIRNGGVVIYPTETVYGIGCAPQIPEAAKRICLAKGRADKPLPIACYNIETVDHIVELNPVAIRLAEFFWPGPLTMVLKAKAEYSIWVTHGAKTLGVRIPDHEVSLKLAKLSGGIIVSTSANKSGVDPAKTAEEAYEQLGSEVDIILDDGPSQGKLPSTVVDLSGANPWILRKGPITANEIRNALTS